jgi:two-component system, cell cycle response regulator
VPKREIMNKKTILVVDDSSTICTIIKNELSEDGYEVVTAKNGIEALSYIEWMEKMPDLITLDIDMPVMGGFEVCERLLAGHEDPDERKQKAARIPILFVSANDTIENRRKGFKLEVIDFISKPFKRGDITRAVEKVLNPEKEFLGMRALIVDDSAGVRRMIRRLLKRNGIEVSEAQNGLQALHLVQNENISYDIVITDYFMPEMCGDELCRLLRQREDMKQVPQFFVSAFDDRDSTLEFFKAGASDYLRKPFIEEELQAKIEIHLRAKKYVNELEKLNKKLENLAVRDGLTGLFNRRYFKEEVDKHFCQASRYNLELSCILLDLDFFKKINDTYGHAFGDLVLVQFAEILKARIRKADIAARYGGEEFVILLPSTNHLGAESFAEKIRSLTSRHIFNDGVNNTHVQISVGISSLKVDKPENPDKLVSFADEALYSAKKGGRNRVCRYGDTTSSTHPETDAVKNQLEH